MSAVKSAVDAERVTREFLSSRFPWSIIVVNRIALNKAEGKWSVSGSYRLPAWLYWAPFTVEIDSQSGDILGFEL